LLQIASAKKVSESLAYLNDDFEGYRGFTMVDDDSGEIWYSEHNGMLSNEKKTGRAGNENWLLTIGKISGCWQRAAVKIA